MRPTIGRIVHFVDAFGYHQAAIVIDVLEGDRVRLAVFHSTGRYEPVTDPVPHDEVPPHAGRSWHWPEREANA